MKAQELSNLLVVRERDVGMFSMCLQVLNTLHLLEDEQIDRVPVLLFGRGLIYFHEAGHAERRNVWEYYFEPVVDHVGEAQLLTLLGERAFDLLESKRKELELARGSVEFPENLHLVPPLDEEDRENLAQIECLISGRNWAWTEAFSPTVDGLGPTGSIARERGADLVRRYIRPRQHLVERVEAIYEARLAGHHVIGVHVRGTDGHSAPARGVTIPFDRYFSEIERRIDAVGRDACRVFLATDEAAIVARFEERLGPWLVYCDTVRKTAGDEIFGVGPTGQVVPGYIAKGGTAAVHNGDDAVLEYALLTRSDLLVHNVSSLSYLAQYSVPESIHV